MAHRPRPELTPEQIALQLQRRQKKLEAAAKGASTSGDGTPNQISSGTSTPTIFDLNNDKGQILVRDWVQLEKPTGNPCTRIKLMTWNMLAQCLVRRDLFPNSDCLKATQREDMMLREVLHYGADIVCLQEVDRLDKYLPIFHSVNYEHTYASGPKKQHGCMILHRSARFKKEMEHVVFYDDEVVPASGGSILTQNEGAHSNKRIGSTRITKNIGLIVALSQIDNPGAGCIVATTHLFWHPRFTYERARQAGILLQAVRKVQSSNPKYASWPAYLAGDFNTQPTEVAYSLLVGNPFSETHKASLAASRVVHLSRDPTVTPMLKIVKDDDEEGGAGDYDDDEWARKALRHSRPARPDDGLLEDDEVIALFGGLPLRSAYEEGLQRVQEEADNTFGVRDTSWNSKGKTEPMWTSFTHFWRLTLDYIFVMDPLEGRSPSPRVTGILKTHRKEHLEPGLPLQGICGSDHISLMVELSTDPPPPHRI